MKERPIIISAPTVRAILAGRKTTTRQLVSVPWRGWQRTLPYSPLCEDEDGRLMFCDEYGDYTEATEAMRCPIGQVGDRLWVRETWTQTAWTDDTDVVSGTELSDGRVHYRADCTVAAGDGWRSPVVMPRWASRITLEIVGIRVERLQAITEAGAEAEGAERDFCDAEDSAHDSSQGEDRGAGIGYTSPRSRVAGCSNDWDRAHGKTATFDSNPWVWVVEFKVVLP